MAVPTGTKASVAVVEWKPFNPGDFQVYGNDIEKMPYDPPLGKSHPEILELEREKNYFIMTLSEASDEKSWSWYEVRPDVVVCCMYGTICSLNSCQTITSTA